MHEIEHEMKIIADSGIEEILMLTGESRSQSNIEYIGEACKLSRKYLKKLTAKFSCFFHSSFYGFK